MTIPDYCLACDRQLAPGGVHPHGDHDTTRHWDGRMPLSVKAGIAWWIAILGVLLAGAVLVVVEAIR